MLSFGGKLLLSSVNLKLVFFFALSRSAKVYLTPRSFGLFDPNKLEIPGINPKYPIITYYYKYDNSSTASEKENPCSSYTRSFSWENSSDNVNRVLCGGMVS